MKHCLDFLINLPCPFPSIEREGRATNSELRRWFNQGSVHVNGAAAKWDDPVPSEWLSLVLHPKGRRKTTVW